MDDQLLIQFRAFLVDEGLVREPDTLGPEPTMWLDPRTMPAPGEVPKKGKQHEAADLVTAAFPAPGVPSRAFHGFLSHDAIEVWLRAARAPEAYDLEQAITRRMVDKRNWDMGAIHVEESMQLRKFQRMGADAQGYTYSVQYGLLVMVGDPI